MKLEVHDVTIRYQTGSAGLVAVDGASLAVPVGGTLGLVGESGCGKSTIARAIVGLLPLAGGSLLLDGVDHSADAMRQSRGFRQQVQMVFQDAYSSLNPRLTIQETLTEALAVGRNASAATLSSRATEILNQVGLGFSALDRYPHQFSGGQQQRIAIGRALAVGARMLVFDEITSALDVSVQATILNLLKDLQRELQLSYLFISHDLSVVRHVSDEVAVMYLGRIVETGPADALFAAPAHPYTRALVDSIPQFGRPRRSAPLSGDVPDPRNPPRGCRFHTRCPVIPQESSDHALCVGRDPQPEAASRIHRAACHFAGNVDRLTGAS